MLSAMTPRRIEGNETMNDEAKKAMETVITKGAKRVAIITESAIAIIEEAERTKAGEIAGAIFAATKAQDCVFPDSTTFREILRSAVKAGYKANGTKYPKANTKAYYDLDNVLRSITRHYAELAVKGGFWKASDDEDEGDAAWDIQKAVKLVVKKHNPEDIKAYIKALSKAIED